MTEFHLAKDVRFAAFHEAGHAVTAWLDSDRVERITILLTPTPIGLGHSGNTRLVGGIPPGSPRETWLAYARFKIAGREAELLAGRTERFPIEVSDEQLEANEIWNEHGLSPDEKRAEGALVIARLREHWPAVQAVAGLLYEPNTPGRDRDIDGATVHAAIDAAERSPN